MAEGQLCDSTPILSDRAYRKGPIASHGLQFGSQARELPDLSVTSTWGDCPIPGWGLVLRIAGAQHMGWQPLEEVSDFPGNPFVDWPHPQFFCKKFEPMPFPENCRNTCDVLRRDTVLSFLKQYSS